MTPLEVTTLIGTMIKPQVVVCLRSYFAGFEKIPLLKVDFFDEKEQRLVAVRLDNVYYLLKKILLSELVELVFNWLKRC